MKAKIIILLIQIALWIILLSAGMWYMSNALGPGGDLPYVSMPRFLNAIGACEGGVCNIASAAGCFLCPYMTRLFMVIGEATEILWDAILLHTWLLMVVGLVIYMFWQAYQILWTALKETGKLDAADKTLDFKKWRDSLIGKDGLLIRILIAGAFLGIFNYGGHTALRTTADIVIYPAMMVGTSLAMAASNTNQAAVCTMDYIEADNVMATVANSFMCVIGNLNVVILSGAASGFSMISLSSQGLGGGFFTWLAGMGVVILFLFVGFNIVFKIINVIFNLVFVVIFLPVFIAMYAFEKAWDKYAKGLLDTAIGLVAHSAVRVLGITLEVVILAAFISYAQSETLSSDPAVEYLIIETCENRAAQEDGSLDKNIYLACFRMERASHPEAFRNVDKGFEFLLAVLLIFFMYHYVLKKKLDEYMGSSDKDDYFKFGTAVREGIFRVGAVPMQIIKRIPGLKPKP